MKVFPSIEEFTAEKKTFVVSIGNYDGVHKGHQAVLKRACDLAHGQHTDCVVFTFSNHPKEVLAPQVPLKKLSSFQDKTRLLEGLGVDHVIAVEFDARFADQDAGEFLRKLHSHVPFSHLVLGYDARFGKDKSGSPEVVKKLAVEMNFDVEYVDPVKLDGGAVSSTRIRKALVSGKLDEAERLLGRKYCVEGEFVRGEGKGRGMGFPTGNIDVSDFSVPPYGVYVAEVEVEGQIYRAVANLGVAPTVRSDGRPILEVHLFDYTGGDLYGKRGRVIFDRFLRGEKKFASVEELQEQIARDIEESKI